MTLLVDLAGSPAHAFPAPFFLAQTGTPAAAPTPAPVTGTSVAPAPVPLPADAQPSPMGALIMPLMIVGIGILIFGPQFKRNKEHQKLITSLQTGDEVVTSSGLFGVITQVKPDRFVVEIAKGTRIEIRRSHVEAKIPDPVESDEVKKP